ncbi:MFS transporter [Streptomyces sp. 8K308]|uniref:CynX/NimT family MFS transporter n=1 Tax=Streptomyces sp. 8K308 TaxID=2530388 RepID=UPI00104F52EA|nr:MFS transporter [Streptomyces sp. 8K308]TDC19869.1 MFS transporter [Streptomyces sp. 8K308]
MLPMESTKDDRTLRTRSPEPPPVARAAAPLLLVAGLALAAFNLRPALASIGPLLPEIRDGLEMNGAVAGLLTSVPALCFAVFGIAAPRLARRHGLPTVLVAGLAALAAGLALRALAGSTPVFLLTSTLALAGVAIGNVLMPVLVKQYFPDRMGTMTGLYSMALSFGAACAAGLSVPLAHALGDDWRPGLGFWALPAAVAVLPWLAALPHARHARRTHPAANRSGSAGGPVAAAPRLARSGTAWALAVFFGLQATAAYVTLGWSPQIYQDAGVSAGTAGVLAAVIIGLGAPIGFVLPPIAARMRHQGPLVALLGAFGLAGYAGLWLAPAGGAWLWAIFLGLANCSFPVVLTMIGMRSRTPQGVVRLSAFAQSIGYLISVPGPLLVGTLNEATGDWHAPLGLMVTLMLIQVAVGFRAGRDRCVEDDG